ncbi:hypothetical protein [Pedococcus sp. 5OH_020]|uniref:hypothetical protein n=1 Tax=Pedococcus sp. 5OH_020 TaxID=2989814 RepID=UPI0022E9C0DA|nr:hypothetical protein [Pedococcus sp. 5OH_020]
MDHARAAYVIGLDGLDEGRAVAACRSALEMVAPEMRHAETDIPWESRDTWPAEVVDSASRLVDRFGNKSKWPDRYMQTGVRSVADAQVRSDFMAVAPYAFDAAFWGCDYREVAQLNDEAMSFVIWLTEPQREALVGVVGAQRVTLRGEWNRSHPSRWRRWLHGLAPRSG